MMTPGKNGGWEYREEPPPVGRSAPFTGPSRWCRESFCNGPLQKGGHRNARLPLRPVGGRACSGVIIRIREPGSKVKFTSEKRAKVLVTKIYSISLQKRRRIYNEIPSGKTGHLSENPGHLVPDLGTNVPDLWDNETVEPSGFAVLWRRDTRARLLNFHFLNSLVFPRRKMPKSWHGRCLHGIVKIFFRRTSCSIYVQTPVAPICSMSS